MAIIVLDGSEKAGKSTLVTAIGTEWVRRLGQGSISRKYPWGPVKSDVLYRGGLIASVGAKDRELIVWDRSWASESVYGLLLMREDRRLATDPWLGEWLYGRAVQTMGLRVMVSSDPKERAARRDKTDLPVDPFMEGVAFQDYGERYGWHMVKNDYTKETLQRNAEDIVNRALEVYLQAKAYPPAYCGPPSASVMVVGEQRNEGSEFPGAWLPLATPMTIRLGRTLGESAFKVGWSNAFEVPPNVVRDSEVLVALGEKAQHWAKFQVGHKNVVDLPHPAWMYRFGAGKDLIGPTEAKLQDVVAEYARP